MTDPQQIETLRDKAQYLVPYYEVTNEGLREVKRIPFHFCKGNKEDETVFRQAGFFSETTLAVTKKYLEENNVGELASEDTAEAIDHIQKALDCLKRRADKRKAAGVQGTYRPTPEAHAVIGQPEGPEN